jgi:hypothetical protein
MKPRDTNLCVKVQQFVFPVSFYDINSTNNSLIYYKDAVLQTEIVIPEGNYSATDLETEIDSQLVSGLSVSYDDKTMKFTFTDTDGEELIIDNSSSCLSLLGFTEGEDHSSTTDGGTEVLTSQYPIDLMPTKCVYVSIPNLSINNINGLTGHRTPILACVPVDEEAGDMVVFTNDLGVSSYTQEEVINEFDIRIYDEDLSTLINFQNQDWLMTLEISYTPA